MSRILLADDSPHAQRMGERILRDEGFEVVTVTDGDTALLRLSDVDPDLVIVDALLPGRSGYDLCEFVKTNPQLRHARVVLTAGLLEPFDEDRAVQVRTDAVLKKPFEASVVLRTIRPLLDGAAVARGIVTELAANPPELDVDSEHVRAAVTLALDAAMPAMIEALTDKVVAALKLTGAPAVGCGSMGKKDSAGLTAAGESVVRRFLQS